MNKIFQRQTLLLSLVITLLTAHFSPLTLHAQKLSISKTTVDVGKTGFEVPVTATFKLRNKGLKSLRISKVKTDCGCTKVDYPQNSIGIGEHFTISLTYDARQMGHFQKQVAVYSNATKKPVYLKMKGVVVEEVHDYSASYPYDFGGLLTDVNELEFDDVNKGDRPQLEINLMNNSEKSLQPNLLHLPSYLEATCVPERLAPNQAGKLTVTLLSDTIMNYGLTQSTVYLAKQLGERVNSEIEIPVSVVLLPDVTEVPRDQAPQIQLTAEELHLGHQNGKHVRSGVINIANTGRSELNIKSLQLFTGGMKVTLSKRLLAPGETTRLKVSVNRDELLRQRTRPRVLMITNDPSRPKVLISVNVK